MNRASAQVTSDKNSLALFYVPGRVVNELGVWGSGVRSHYKEAVKSLIQVMKFNRENKVGWIAEAEGADMLSGALGKLSGSFAGHRFRLIDPLTNTPLLLQKLKEKEIQPARDEAAPVVYSGSNRAANIYMEAQKEAVVHALKMLRVKGLAIEPHQAAVAELESGGDPASPRSQRALANTGALSHSFPGPKVNTNRSLLSFITALKRV